jgi:alanyl-tRNA synthetase
MNHYTLKNWMKKVLGEKRSASSSKEKRPQDWRPEEQLVALHESHGLEGEALQGWCRERGLPVARELGTLKVEIQQLKRELLRKEKALAEAAALLILQKKFQAFWEDEGK